MFYAIDYKKSKQCVLGSNGFQIIDQDHASKVKGASDWFLKLSTAVIYRDAEKLE